MTWKRRDFVKATASGIAGAALPTQAVPEPRSAAAPKEQSPFLAAQPIWPAGRTKEKNLFVGFRCVVTAPAGRRVLLRITASSLYRAFLNGDVFAHGPARGPHGWFRVDEWDLTGNLHSGINHLAIEVAGYNINSYYLLDQPAFLQAEVVTDDGRVLTASGQRGNPIQATVLKERVQKVQRYSFQRTFSEVYRLTPGHDSWRRDAHTPLQTAECETTATMRYLPRGAPYPKLVKRQPLLQAGKGNLRPGKKTEKLWRDRALTGIGPTLGGFTEQELETIPSLELQQIESVPDSQGPAPFSAGTKLQLPGQSYAILDLGVNLTGFIGAKVTCRKASRFLFVFDEILTRNDVDFTRLGCVNIVACELQAGTYEIESFEPYTLRYLKLMVLEGDCEVEGIYLRELTNPEGWTAQFAAADPRLNRLFTAGRENFQQNATDIFMDCPSRERAGWLCDSFFTARSAFDLCGNTTIESCFFENYLLPERFPHHPEGMLPMCYPSDHNDGVFIPNWALWFVVQLEEYLGRSGDRAMVQALQPKVMALFRYFEPFRNADGLLEKLASWVFIEWSKANSFTQDVNYPTNMLYAAALGAAGRMFGEQSLIRQSETVRKTVTQQSFDGDFFVDNALRTGGRLEVTRNRTEVCQYYAFFFNVATPQSHPALWKRLKEEFGPRRKITKAFPEVHPANAFIGNMLRMEILSRYGLTQQILHESVDYFLYMAERTGTLWENIDDEASCNHGFASHIVRTLNRDVLGIHAVDPVGKVVRLRFPALDLAWCEGILPIGEGRVVLAWRLEGNRLKYRVSVPAGYRLEIENMSGKEVSLA